MSSAANSPFDRRVVIAVVVAGVLAFAAFLWLSAYAPAMRTFDDRGFAPLSKNAVGFAGIFKLIEDVTGETVKVLEGDQALEQPGLVVMPLSVDSNWQTIRKFAEDRSDKVGDGATLFILPKWQTRRIGWRSGDWVRRGGRVSTLALNNLAHAVGGLDMMRDPVPAGSALHGLPGVRQRVTTPTSVIARLGNGRELEPLLWIDQNRVVLARATVLDGGPVYLLSDPDLLANHALKTTEGARTAMAIVAAVRPAGSRISVDPEPARGSPRPRERNLLQLMFEPPFLALTLSILAAALLAALHAFGRFGPALPEPRAIPFGKRALADNAAVLFARAGAVARLGDRYVALTRDAAAQTLGATHLAAPALEAWLARLPRARGPDFATLAANLRDANDADAVRSGAAAMHDWKNEVTRGR